MASVVLLVLVAVLAVEAYDFRDVAFNDFLLNDLENVENSLDLTVSRVRRSMDSDDLEKKCKDWKKPKYYCCADEQFQDLMESSKETKVQCFKAINPDVPLPWFLGGEYHKHKKHPDDGFNSKKHQYMKDNITCIYECFGKKFDLISEDGNLIKNNLNTWLSNRFPLPWQQNVIPNVLTQCLNEAKDPNTKLDIKQFFGHGRHGGRHHKHHHKCKKDFDDNSPSACSKVMIKFMACIFREIQANCPNDQIKNEKYCELKNKRQATPPSSSQDDDDDEDED